jgi:hypothetical protein
VPKTVAYTLCLQRQKRFPGSKEIIAAAKQLFNLDWTGIARQVKPKLGRHASNTIIILKIDGDRQKSAKTLKKSSMPGKQQILFHY